VLSSGIADRLFPYQDPLGRRIFLSENRDYYEVIGVLQYRTPMSFSYDPTADWQSSHLQVMSFDQ